MDKVKFEVLKKKIEEKEAEVSELKKQIGWKQVATYLLERVKPTLICLCITFCIYLGLMTLLEASEMWAHRV